MPPNLNIGDVLTWARETLSSTSDAPDIDAERLLLHVLHQQDSNWLHAHNDETLTQQQRTQFNELLGRRSAGEPLAYITEVAEFYGRPFAVTPDVLIPRPETEELVRQTKEYVKTHSVSIIADVGTGSGCIAITLALELPTSIRIIATDVSPAALKVAKQNAATHRVSDRITFLEGNMLAPLHDKNIDLIISNPPYVPTSELDQPSTKETRGLSFEPRIALDGGSDGNRFVDTIVASDIPGILEIQNGDIVSVNM